MGSPFTLLLAGISLTSMLAPFLVWFHRWVQDLLFTARVSWGLWRNPRHKVPVLYKALSQHSTGTVACCYTLRGRLYFVKKPSQIRRVMTHKPCFEKLKSPKNSPIGRILGEAITASGDDPVTWREAKRHMRSAIHMPSLIPAFGLVATSLTNQVEEWAQKGDSVMLYKQILKSTLPSTYKAFFGVDLEQELKARESSPHGSYTLDEFVDLVDLVSNTYRTAQDELDDRFQPFVRQLGRDFLARAPEGSFGHGIQQMVDDDSTSFTLDAGIGNAIFYVHALPVMTSLVLHWAIYRLQVRHPEHLERIRSELDAQGSDRAHFRACLKEVLRLYQPAMFMVRRVKQDTVLDGVTLKKQSMIVPWTKLLVDQDLSFNPQRWVHNTNLVDEAVNDQSGILYAPFAFGARQCLGKELVVSIFEDTVASVLQKFDFELKEPDPWQDLPPALQHTPDPMIGFRPNRDLLFSIRERLTTEQ